MNDNIDMPALLRMISAKNSRASSPSDPSGQTDPAPGDLEQIKIRVLDSENMPRGLAAYLTGNTEDEITADARKLKQYITGAGDSTDDRPKTAPLATEETAGQYSDRAMERVKSKRAYDDLMNRLGFFSDF